MYHCFIILSISQAETVQADLKPEQQAKQQITVHPYATFNSRKGNYLYIATGTNTVSVGDRMSLKLSISTADPSHRPYIQHVTYMVRQEHHVTHIQYTSKTFRSQKVGHKSQTISKSKTLTKTLIMTFFSGAE